ncbi:MAG TPA: hypothetical protein V6D17_14590 [Candidatus Obscuribacterales bacterium]
MRAQRKRSSPLVALCAVILGAQAATEAMAAGSSSNGWLLKQKSDFYGPIDIFLSSQGLKFISTKAGIIVIAHPDGKVYAYNPDTKKVFETDAQHFGKGPLAKRKSRQATARSVYIIGKGEIARLKVTKYRNFTDGDLKKIQTERQDRRRKRIDPDFTSAPVEFWSTSDIKLPTSFSAIVNKVTRIENIQAPTTPHSKGKTQAIPIPLRIMKFSSGGHAITTLDTVDCRTIKVSSNDFKVPKGLKHVPNEMALFFDTEGEDDMDLFGGLPASAATSPARHGK